MSLITEWVIRIQSFHFFPIQLQGFDTAIASNDRVVVLFYFPSCPMCKKFRPHFARAAEEMGSEILFLKVNLDWSPNLIRKFSVKSTPKVIFFERGNPFVYSGPLETEPFLEFLSSARHQNMRILSHLDLDTLLLRSLDFKIPLLIANLSTSMQIHQSRFDDLAKRHPSLLFGSILFDDVADAELRNASEFPDAPSLTLFCQFDNNRVERMSTEYGWSQLETFLGYYVSPVLDWVHEPSFEHAMKQDVALHVFLILQNTTQPEFWLSFRDAAARSLPLIHESSNMFFHFIKSNICCFLGAFPQEIS